MPHEFPFAENPQARKLRKPVLVRGPCQTQLRPIGAFPSFAPSPVSGWQNLHSRSLAGPHTGVSSGWRRPVYG
eukprot:3536166-Prymnesium_polylepis.1